MSGISSVVLIVHIIVAIAMIGVILLQRSEGGALGIGGGSGGFLSARSAGNVLTRTTTILVAAFFLTSIALTVLARHSAPKTLDLNAAPAAAGAVLPQPTAPQPAAPAPSSNDLPALPGFQGSNVPDTADGNAPAAAPEQAPAAIAPPVAAPETLPVPAPSGTPEPVPATP